MVIKLTWRERLFGQATVKLPMLPAASPTTTPTITHSYSPWTIQLWQKSEIHRQYAKDLLAEPRFRDLLALLSNMRPRPITKSDINPTSAAIGLGMVEGYEMCLAIFPALAAMPMESAAEVPADYGATAFNPETGQFSDLQ